MMISVVIPTHNRCDLLPRAIRSVQEQTIKDLEIIVVSDGSTDGTDYLMDSLKKEDSRINYIAYHPGHNGNFARNTGIKAAKGEYIAFLDDDDEWLPTKLDEQLKIMNSDDNIGLVYTGTHVIYADEGVDYPSISNISGDLSVKILWANCVGSTTTVMVRKSILEVVGLFDEKLPALQDYDLWIRICQVATVGVVPKELVDYYNYSNSGQVSSNTKKYEEAFAYLNNKYTNLYNRFSKREKKLHQSDIKIALGERNIRNGKSKEARQLFVESMRIKVQRKAIVAFICSFIPYKFLIRLKACKYK